MDDNERQYLLDRIASLERTNRRWKFFAGGVGGVGLIILILFGGAFAFVQSLRVVALRQAEMAAMQAEMEARERAEFARQQAEAARQRADEAAAKARLQQKP
jgi:hypothetical protein